MKVISHHAAIPLHEKAKELSETGYHTWRCIFLHLSDRQERNNHMLRTHFINNAISELLINDEGYVYFCEDGDIFILFEGALKPVLAKLGRHFGDLTPNLTWERAGENLFTIFDLSSHWPTFFNLCEEKYVETIATPEELRSHIPHAGYGTRYLGKRIPMQ